MTTLTPGGQKLADALVEEGLIYRTDFGTYLVHPLGRDLRPDLNTAATTLALDAPPAGGGDGSLREAARTLLDASIQDYGLTDDDLDGESVAWGASGGTEVTFGHLRRLKAALARPDHREQAAAGVGVPLHVDHEFKAHPSVFHPARRGEKTFEFRKDDRGGYHVGQIVCLRCFAPETGYTADAPLYRIITDILRPGEFGLQDGYCILSLQPLTQPNPPEAAAPSGSVADAVHYAYRAGAVWAAENPRHADMPGQGTGAADRYVAALAQQPAPQAPTDNLVDRFAAALKAKLRASEAKYGWRNGWLKPGWEADCQRDLARHVTKGDPLDVAAYAAFCWHHGWKTALQAPVADAAGATVQVIPADWLWSQLMDWCKARRLPPAQYSDLFAIVGRARAALTPPQAARPGDGEDGWRRAKLETVIGITVCSHICGRVGSDERQDLVRFLLADFDDFLTGQHEFAECYAPAPVQADAAEGRS